MKEIKGPKILALDIETAPLLSSTWGIWDQNIALNQIEREWFVLSWAAAWVDKSSSPKDVMYMDQRNAKNIEDDKKILDGIWKLLDECDIVLSQNGISFDIKKLNARFAMHGMSPPSPFRHIDTLKIAKKYFAFTSNKLEWMSDKFCVKYKKLNHKKYPGFEMWKECLKGNKDAFKSMEKYNKWDVLSLIELYKKLQPWDSSLNFNTYKDDINNRCNCGEYDLIKRGFSFTNTGKYQRYKCNSCGNWTAGKINLLSKIKKAALRK